MVFVYRFNKKKMQSETEQVYIELIWDLYHSGIHKTKDLIQKYSKRLPNLPLYEINGDTNEKFDIELLKRERKLNQQLYEVKERVNERLNKTLGEKSILYYDDIDNGWIFSCYNNKKKRRMVHYYPGSRDDEDAKNKAIDAKNWYPPE